MIDMVIAEDQAMLRDSLACAIDMQDDMHVVFLMLPGGAVLAG